MEVYVKGLWRSFVEGGGGEGGRELWSILNRKIKLLY